MSSKLYSMTLAVSMLMAPTLALAQTTQSDSVPGAPTANSAASQVGKVPPAAKDENGNRVEPSHKLWNNPRTEAEQPGTQPPSNGGNGQDATTSRGTTTPGPQTEKPDQPTHPRKHYPLAHSPK